MNPYSKFFELPSTWTPLCQFMADQGSDKSNAHTYTQFYHFVFAHRRRNIERVFEMGIGTNNVDVPSNMGQKGVPGASLRAWRTYFPNAQIYGADVDDRVLFQEDRIATCYADQRSEASICKMWNTLLGGEGQVDIIIDDGLHCPQTNATMLRASYNRLKPSGIYVIEDVFYPEDLAATLCAYNPHVVRIPKTNTPDNNLIVIVKD